MDRGGGEQRVRGIRITKGRRDVALPPELALVDLDAHILVFCTWLARTKLYHSSETYRLGEVREIR